MRKQQRKMTILKISTGSTRARNAKIRFQLKLAMLFLLLRGEGPSLSKDVSE